MPALKPLPRHKAARLLERAKALMNDAAYADAAALLEEAAPRLEEPEAELLLAKSQGRQGKNGEALATLERAHRRFPKDALIALELGVPLARLGQNRRAAGALRVAEPLVRKSAEWLGINATVLLQLGQSAEAVALAKRAVTVEPGEKTEALLCVALAANDQLAEAVDVAKKLSGGGELAAACELGARAAIALGDVDSAVALWSRLDSHGRVPEASLPSFALALELSGDSKRADAVLKRAPKDDLTHARILLNRRDLQGALDLVEKADGDELELALIRARALRLSGRVADAAAVLDTLQADDAPPAVVSVVLAERGHVLLDQRQFDLAQRAYQQALEADAGNDEAQQGLTLTKRQLSWKEALEQRAFEQQQAAKLEVESLKRLLAARQRELDDARKQVVLLQSAREEAEAARPAKPEATVDERLPASVRPLFIDAEATYQRSKAEPLSPVAVAFLFVTALERLLHELFVAGFSAQLDDAARAAFLRGAVREVRKGRPFYFDRFVQAFDPLSADRTPGLGELARALTRRKHAYLAPFAQYVDRRFGPRFDADAVAAALERVKTTRDAIAHGRSELIDLDAFRKEIHALLPTLLGSAP
jgi:tetratricopeptide (TPR) repeat protein